MNLTKNENQAGSFAGRLHVFTNHIALRTLTYMGENTLKDPAQL